MTLYPCWIFIVSCLAGCTSSGEEKTARLFTEVTSSAGVDFRYTFGDTTYQNILESSGSGVTIFDYDGDGAQDIYLLNGTWLDGISDPEGRIYATSPNRLYRNNGDGTFTEVSAEAGLDDTHWSMAAGVIDFDTDGDLDLYLLNYGPNVFYQNNGDGTFTDITIETGLQGPDSLNGFTKWSVGVVFWDENHDGALDLMVGNFLAFDPTIQTPGHPDWMPHPNAYLGQPSFLYRQTPKGRFDKVSEASGLYFPTSKCMGLAVFDADGDGDKDILQANDHQSNFLFRKDRSDHYQEVGLGSGLAVNNEGAPTGSMHPTIGDVDGDGLIDVLITDLEHGALYRNLGQGLYEDITTRSGLADLFTGKGAWGAMLFDMDNDGDLDLFSANGAAEVLTEQYPLLLENDGTGHFTNAGPKWGAYFNAKRSGRGAAPLDMDNDGDLDLIISHVDLTASTALLRNDLQNGYHWLGLHLMGPTGTPSWPGSRITVYSSKKNQVRLHQPANGYLSSGDQRMHIGLGTQSAVDQIDILWPDGSLERFDTILIDHYQEIRQGSGRPVPTQ